MTSKPVSKVLLERISSCIRTYRLLEDGELVIVAVSGGSDSISLLHLLHQSAMDLRLVAVYVDHGLRPEETPLEEQNIKLWCDKLRMPFIIERIDVTSHSTKTGRSLEESARLLRYETLEKIRCRLNGHAIAVGHTADDQVEEFFIRLIRGSGARGLSGMEPKNGHVIRPLLFETKDTLERFLGEQEITWNVDSSNFDRRFLRNRVRRDLLPLLEKEFNPAIRKSVLRNMDILREEDSFMEQEAKAAFGRAVSSKRLAAPVRTGDHLTVDIQEFGNLHPALARRVMEKCCWQMGARPTYLQIHALIALAGKVDNCGEVHLGGGLRAVRGPGSVKFLHPLTNGRLRGSPPPLPPVRLPIPATGKYLVPEIRRLLVLNQLLSGSQPPVDEEAGLRVDLDRIVFPLLLKSAMPGERFYPSNGQGTRKISRYFNDRKIPLRDRPTHPVLWSGDRIVAVVGLQVDHYFRVRDTTTRILQISWQKVDAE